MPQYKKTLADRVAAGTFEARRPPHRLLLVEDELVETPELRRLQISYRRTSSPAKRIDLARAFEALCRRPPQPPSGVRTLYVLRVDDSHAKIGVTADLARRRRQLELREEQELSVEASFALPAPLAFAIETLAGAHFADDHRGGEIFSVPPGTAADFVAAAAGLVSPTAG